MIDEQILLLADLEALFSAFAGGIRTAFLPRTEKALGEWAKWGKGDWTGVGGWELKMVGDGASNQKEEFSKDKRRNYTILV